LLRRWLCLIPIIGGVAVAALKRDSETGEIDFNFTYPSLVGAAVSNLFAAFKSNEIKRLMGTPGIKDRIGSAGNQFAVQTIFATLMLVPIMLYKEWHLLPEFSDLFSSSSELSKNLILSGLTFYIYNELACYTLTKVSAITQSVANTAKRVVVIIGSAAVFGESISGLKAIGCFICIAGVFLDSIIDTLLAPSEVAAVEKTKSVILPAEVKASAVAVAKRTPAKRTPARSKSPAPSRAKSPAKASPVSTRKSPARGRKKSD
jgi:solute carrier family 35 protein E1